MIGNQDRRVKDISRLMVCFYVHHHITSLEPGEIDSTQQSTSMEAHNKDLTKILLLQLQFMWDCGYRYNTPVLLGRCSLPGLMRLVLSIS